MKSSLVTAEQLVQYKRDNHYIGTIHPPKVVIICYQSSTFHYFLQKYPQLKQSEVNRHLYILEEDNIAILGDFGAGAPALAIDLEQLIVLGMHRFVAVGTGGSLGEFMPGAYVFADKALAEDGVAHHYLSPDKPYATASHSFALSWNKFSIHPMPTTTAWSYSALFKESLEDVRRVKALGCGIVEMEAATLYAIAAEKGVEAISLFTISDEISEAGWHPHVREAKVRDRLHELADTALEFAKQFPS